MNIIAGIDYSLTGPAVCVFSGDGLFTFNQCNFYYLTDTKKYSRSYRSNIHGQLFAEYNAETERYKTIADWACNKLVGCSRIALEDYAYSRGHAGRVFHIAENTGVLKYKIWEMGLPIDTFSPTSIKKFATGKGNAKKTDMYEAFVRDTGVHLMGIMNMKTLNNPITDIVDSYYICHKMHEHLFPDTTS